MNVLRKGSYWAVTAACIALAALTTSLAAQAHTPEHAAAQATAPTTAELGSRLQLTETNQPTDSVAITDTMGMTATDSRDDAADDSTPATGNAVTATTTMTTAAGMMMGGSGPDDALSPTGEETTLAAGETRWYTFKYDWDGESDPSEALAELRMAVPGAVSFEVWSQDDLDRWRNGEDFTPTGAGTPAFATGDDTVNNRDRTLLRWVGSSEATVTYHLIVSNNIENAVAYTLTVSGETVSFPAPAELASSPMMTSTMPMTDSMAMSDTAMMGMMMGMGPDDALTPNGRREVLGAGESRWYIFKYNWDGEDNPSNAVVELRMAEAGSVNFEIWSEANVNAWRNNESFNPTGTGTPAFALSSDSTVNNRDRSLLRWTGGDEETVTYYIIVENNRDSDAVYRLTVSGRDVSFPGVAANQNSATPATDETGDNSDNENNDDASNDDANNDDADIDDSEGMTDTTGITDTIGMTNTPGITNTDDLTDTEEDEASTP